MLKFYTILACDGPPWIIIHVFNAISHSGHLLEEVAWAILVKCIIPLFSKENIEQTFQYDQKSQTDKFQEGKVCVDQICNA